MSRKCIETFVRLRPLNDDELATWPDCLVAAQRTGAQSLVFNPARLEAETGVQKFSATRARLNFDQTYAFDEVFDADSAETYIYSKVVAPRLDSLFAGVNGSLFAYGATGCGKTHTISALLRQLAGDLFARAAKFGPSPEVRIEATYMQLYNDRLLDLLAGTGAAGGAVGAGGAGAGGAGVGGAPRRAGRDLLLLDTGIANISMRAVETPAQLSALVAEGQRRRVVAATRANSQSSRSHAILTLYVTRQSRTGPVRTHLSVIDLAGSERAQGTTNSGQLIREGANINQSLLALGNCIKARESRSAFIPYRSSKLTRLLRPSLDGTCDTAMIICVSPSYRNFDDTKNSLEYGRRCSNIQGMRLRSQRAAAPPGFAEVAAQVQALERQLSVASQQVTLMREERDTHRRWSEMMFEVFPVLQQLVEERGGMANVEREDIIACMQAAYLSGGEAYELLPGAASELVLVEHSSPGKRRRA